KEFEEKVGEASSTEIAEIEQALINEGLSPDEIKKFCNVHALLFQKALEKSVIKETSPSHPVYLFKLENRETAKRLESLKELAKKHKELSFEQWKAEIKQSLNELKKITIHYDRKEQVLFPYLEKAGFFGPSKVMWGKDNEIRDLLRESISGLEKAENKDELKNLFQEKISLLMEEIQGMIFKEENILFPTCLEKLDSGDWVQILKESDDVGYVFIEKPKETEALIKDLEHAQAEEPVFEEEKINLPTGTLSLNELMNILNTLPVDVTFVDKDDRVRYYSDNKDRIFVRTRSVIGRQVQHCHPPQSLDKVENIINSFNQGRNEPHDFWIDLQGKKIFIRYFPVRDKQGNYLGVLEVSQDITEIQKLKGEKRL
ncbi:MAG: DUF438 domain-containing protein, partial [Acidobacteriota bacterium]